MTTMTHSSPATRVSDEARQEGRSRARRRDALTASAFLAPGMIAFLLFVIVPTLGSLALSFFRWDLFDTPVFIGVDNFTRLLGDQEVWSSLFVSLMFVVLGVIPVTMIGFLLAVTVNSRMPGVGILRVFYLAPILASSAVSALIWVNIYQPRSGLLNEVLALIGIHGPNWLSDIVWARPALVVMMIWGGLPLVILLYMSGLQRIPTDIYDAASIDGAGKWRQLWSMTWPSVRSSTAVILVLQIVGFLSGSFEIALILTQGGPLGQTTSLALYAYQQAFQHNDQGYASALSLFQLLLLVVIFVVVQLIRRIARSRR